jgi:hypothetical protein
VRRVKARHLRLSHNFSDMASVGLEITTTIQALNSVTECHSDCGNDNFLKVVLKLAHIVPLLSLYYSSTLNCSAPVIILVAALVGVLINYLWISKQLHCKIQKSHYHHGCCSFAIREAMIHLCQ